MSRYGAMAIAWTMDKLGPMAHTADDCGLVLSVIAGHDPQDHDSLPNGVAEFHYSRNERIPAKFLRVGRLTNVWLETEPGLDPAVNDALKVLEKKGAKISDAEIPDGPYEEAAELTILMEAASAFQDLIAAGRAKAGRQTVRGV